MGRRRRVATPAAARRTPQRRAPRRPCLPATPRPSATTGAGGAANRSPAFLPHPRNGPGPRPRDWNTTWGGGGGARGPAGGPSGARYTTVRRAGWARLGSVAGPAVSAPPLRRAGGEPARE